MKLRYIIDEVGQNGTRNSITRDFEQTEIIIGRGSTSHIIIDSRYLSLTHAKLSFDGKDLYIEDLVSLSGTLVNDERITRTKLQSGDEVLVGDILFKVRFGEGIWSITEMREEHEKEDIDAVVAKQYNALQLSSRLPRMVLISLVCVILVGAIFGLYPFLTNRWNSWSSGPISNNHLMIEKNCSACHDGGFKAVRDEKCMSCHTMSDHSPAFQPATLSRHAGLQVRCATCHMEHNGDTGLVVRTSALCSNCHSNTKAVYPDAQLPNVPNFSQHPEFSVTVQPARPGMNATRVRMDDSQNLKDNSFVKLNHERHLRSLRGPKGEVKLDCRRCHEPTPDLKGMQPINYERHCQECHGLEFDDRLQGRQVPHGDPEVVYKFLYAEYAKLFLSKEPEDKPLQEAFNIRARPGSVMPSVAEQPQSNEDFTRAFVEKQSRSAETQLFTKTACYLCHLVNIKDLTPQEGLAKQTSLFEVYKPQIPSQWMPEAIFSHGAHEEMRCDECHTGVYSSTKTTQVLLPKIEKCVGCHTEGGGHRTVKSDCVMCHSFHDPLVTPPERKRKTHELLAAVW